jgi:hypothetical protein
VGKLEDFVQQPSQEDVIQVSMDGGGFR